MLISKDYQTLICRSTKVQQDSVMMSYLTRAEENKLDKGETINIKRGNMEFEITPNDVYAYGDVDFSSGSEDMETLSYFNWLDKLDSKGVDIPSDYNYKEHCCYSPIPKVRWTETFSPEKLVKYKHGVLGKPDRVIIFRYVKYGKSVKIK